MGIGRSKHKQKQSPSGFTSLRISSLNVDLKKSLSLIGKLRQLIDYIYSPTAAEIVCLQGFNDSYTISQFAKLFLNDPRQQEHPKTVVPSLDEYANGGASVSFSASLTFHSLRQNSKMVRSIIVSKYPIDDFFVEQIGGGGEDYFPEVFLICANIRIDRQLISIYTSALTLDVPFYTTDRYRSAEIAEIRRLHLENRGRKKNLFHLFAGSLHITEKVDGMIHDEYADAIVDGKLIDIFRVLNGEANGFTTSDSKRYDYQMLLCTDAIHTAVIDQIVPYNDELTKKQVIDEVFKQTGAVIVKTYISQELRLSKHSIVETSLMFRE